MVVSRFDVYLVDLPAQPIGDARAARLCLVVSPDESHRYVTTVLVAPMTTRARPYPTRVPCRFNGKHGQIALDQLRTIDKALLVRHLGRVGSTTQKDVQRVLAALFAS